MLLKKKQVSSKSLNIAAKKYWLKSELKVAKEIVERIQQRLKDLEELEPPRQSHRLTRQTNAKTMKLIEMDRKKKFENSKSLKVRDGRNDHFIRKWNNRSKDFNTVDIIFRQVQTMMGRIMLIKEEKDDLKVRSLLSRQTLWISRLCLS
ncbi:hypothetical protein FNV43_RR02398 [Rhamnella rubrinervis]|uniref:Uncharacterized protein n=1 Tax=Rhamnella rubrinervis TaxID=2594499 RepID=A0A8K0HTP0_9ROSA|nr:hypothetical protein FNV43_RR02398 [Rhamnella rubrinervis]